MAKRHTAKWELRVRGQQREPLEADLLAQIVVMLGRHLSQETMTDTHEASGTAPAAAGGEGAAS